MTAHSHFNIFAPKSYKSLRTINLRVIVFSKQNLKNKAWSFIDGKFVLNTQVESQK